MSGEGEGEGEGANGMNISKSIEGRKGGRKEGRKGMEGGRDAVSTRTRQRWCRLRVRLGYEGCEMVEGGKW